jgi:hypothetical protein
VKEVYKRRQGAGEKTTPLADGAATLVRKAAEGLLPKRGKVCTFFSAPCPLKGRIKAVSFPA